MSAIKPPRPTFIRRKKLEEEKKFPWLSLLLDAYSVIDEGGSAAVKKEKKRRGARLACRKGCDVCCRFQTDIPVYPLELVGLYWYCTEALTGPERDMVKASLLAHTPEGPCPFLLRGSCAVHFVRPAACRQYNVFEKACAPGEDAFFTRRQDVLTPLKEYTGRAFFITMPFYGITDDAARARAVEGGYLHTRAQNLQTYDWRPLARSMEEFEKAGPA